MPTMGIFTAFEASWTMRTAIGLIAGPERPPVTLAMRGRRVSTSMASDDEGVDERDGVGARRLRRRGPSGRCLVTLGESFTIRGRCELPSQRLARS